MQTRSGEYCLQSLGRPLRGVYKTWLHPHTHMKLPPTCRQLVARSEAVPDVNNPRLLRMEVRPLPASNLKLEKPSLRTVLFGTDAQLYCALVYSRKLILRNLYFPARPRVKNGISC